MKNDESELTLLDISSISLLVKDRLNNAVAVATAEIARRTEDLQPEYLSGFFDTLAVPDSANFTDYETFFEDDVSDEANHIGTFCYLIQAIESDGNIYSHKDSSRSNIVCNTIAPKVYIPNSFTPNDNGLNDVFKPQVSYADPENYYFAIYNRFGNLIFDTNDYSVGWDGMDAPVGLYVYYLRFSDGTAEIQEVRSSVTLIR